MYPCFYSKKFDQTRIHLPLGFITETSWLISHAWEIDRFSEFFVDTERFDLCRNGIWVCCRRVYSENDPSFSTSNCFWIVRLRDDSVTPAMKVSCIEHIFNYPEDVSDWLFRNYSHVLTESNPENGFSRNFSQILTCYNVVRLTTTLKNSEKAIVEMVQLSKTDYFAVGTLEVNGYPQTDPSLATLFGNTKTPTVYFPCKAVEGFRAQNPKMWDRLAGTDAKVTSTLFFGLTQDTSCAHYEVPPVSLLSNLFAFPRMAAHIDFFGPEDKNESENHEDSHDNSTLVTHEHLVRQIISALTDTNDDAIDDIQVNYNSN